MKYNNKRIRAVASVAFAVTSALSMAGAPQANAAAFQGTSTMVDPEIGAQLLTESGSMTTRTSSTDGFACG